MDGSRDTAQQSLVSPNKTAAKAGSGWQELTTTAHGKWHYTKIKEGKLARPERKKPSALSTKVLALLDVDAATGTRGRDKGMGQG